MDVMDKRIGEKVGVHDRGCPKRLCYGPLCMALVGGREFWKCGGWGGNEETCENENI
jgi:hypothetical protein